VGLSRAKKILFSAERFDAREALTIGFVDHVSQAARTEPDGWLNRLPGLSREGVAGDPMVDARAFAKSLTLNAPLTQKGAKTILNGLAFGRGSLNLQYAEHLIAQAAASGGLSGRAARHSPRDARQIPKAANWNRVVFITNALESLAEVLTLLNSASSEGRDARIMAGGQSSDPIDELSDR
jgi:enoyl-CoA hydratase/carnithine racemase